MDKTNYTKYYNNPKPKRDAKPQNGSENNVRPSEKQEAAPKEERRIIGVVTNCMYLRVRKEPSFESDVLRELPCLDEVIVDKQRSTDDFYAVRTNDNIVGFCMKKYIVLRDEQ